MDDRSSIVMNWQYDYWTDIQVLFPVGKIIECQVTNVRSGDAWLKTFDNIECYLRRIFVISPWAVSDLSEVIKVGDRLACKVRDYNFDKKQLIVSVDLNS